MDLVLKKDLQLDSDVLSATKLKKHINTSRFFSTQTDHDYQQLSTITTGKSLPLMKYQTLSLCKSNKRPRWSIA